MTSASRSHWSKSYSRPHANGRCNYGVSQEPYLHTYVWPVEFRPSLIKVKTPINWVILILFSSGCSEHRRFTLRLSEKRKVFIYLIGRNALYYFQNPLHGWCYQNNNSWVTQMWQSMSQVIRLPRNRPLQWRLSYTGNFAQHIECNQPVPAVHTCLHTEVPKMPIFLSDTSQDSPQPVFTRGCWKSPSPTFSTTIWPK